MDVITARGLSKRYRRTWALREVDLAVPDGGVTALVGPNGAGKSTLLKLCIGFERPTAGAVDVLGINASTDRGGAIARVGYVPQAPSLHRELSVEDHIAMARAIRPGFDAAHARERLACLAIPLSAKPNELSGGQHAQVSLAIALGTRAPVLLLDEPLANLDPLARREFLGTVSSAVGAGDVTAILSSHVISDVEPVCDRLLVLADGRVLVHETVAAALARHRVAPEGAIVGAGASLVSAFPDRAGRIQSLHRVAPGTAPGNPPSLEDLVMGYLASMRPSAVAA